LFPDPSMGASAPAPEAPAADVEEVLSRFLSEIKAAAESDGQVSQNERLLIEKLTTIGQQFLANREKEDQAALGGGPATNSISRILGGV
jgi:uncharacterized membrane protein YebE (DUF533 family)